MSNNQQPITNNLPTHLAIIMDGNGRWAKARGLPRVAGHKRGADALKITLENCRESGINYLTIYAFSAENWNRPVDEINDLMQLLQHYLQRELETMHQSGVRLRFIGDLEKLDAEIREQIEYASEFTKRNDSFHLTIALSYGGRQEIVRVAKKLAQQVASGVITQADITEELFDKNLYTHDLPELDLLIRTGGEKRLSNFLLWQAAYTEFYFTETLWPDFDKADFTDALNDFAKRERRYGTTGE